LTRRLNKSSYTTFGIVVKHIARVEITTGGQ